MDFVDIYDLIAVIAASIVAIKIRDLESALLLLFFSISAITSFYMFEGEYYTYWPAIFTVISVSFGLMSLRHPIVLGYAAYLLIIGLNQHTVVTYYSEYIYLIFAYQLWIVTYGRNYGHRISASWSGFFDKTSNKDSINKEPQQ